MKRFVRYSMLTLLTGAMLTASCTGWDEHFNVVDTNSDHIEIYAGDVASYVKNASDLTKIASVFDSQAMFDDMYTDRGYTLIVCGDNDFDAAIVGDGVMFAKNCISDMSISPDKLVPGYGIATRSNKNVWVYAGSDAVKIDDYEVVKTVKADNGYIYYVAGTIAVRPSVYEYLQSLGDDYSRFKELVAKYEEVYFDAESSIPDGYDEQGNVVYSDSVIIMRNTLMDRYTEDGLEIWNMKDEAYASTMFVPNNQLVDRAISNAAACIPVWLNRQPTAADTAKFEKWIVRACFVDRRLPEAEVMAGAPDFACVGGHLKKIDVVRDQVTYPSIEPAYWRPSVQTVDVANKVNLSNGVAYHCNNLKIPNHEVIYRVKSVFYQYWDVMTPAQKEEYFKWDNWTLPQIVQNAQSEFQLSQSLPTMYYHVLTAIPTEEAWRDSLMCSVTYDGLQYNTETGQLSECNLPAGEYYLRMGFKHSLTYSLSIYFNDSLLVKDMCMYATGSNFHFDRGAASEVPHYGEGAIAYPEGFNPDEWIELDPKAIAYDTDGYTVGVVNLKQGGNFKIKVESYDQSYLYEPADSTNWALERNKNNVSQLMMYHWCLRPTIKNY